MSASQDEAIYQYRKALDEYYYYQDNTAGVEFENKNENLRKLEEECDYWKNEYENRKCEEITGKDSIEFKQGIENEHTQSKNEDAEIKYRNEHSEQFDISDRYQGAVERRVELEQQKAEYMKNHSDLQGKREYVEQLEKYDEQINKAYEDEMFMNEQYESHNCQEVNGGMDGPRFSSNVETEYRKKMNENTKDEKEQKKQELYNSMDAEYNKDYSNSL